MSRWMRGVRLSRLFAAGALLGAMVLSSPVMMGQVADGRKKVIFDQDTDGIIGGNEDPLIMLLQAGTIDVLGVTVVTGNGWLRQETADVLKLLEEVHRTDVPVYMGAEFPLVQSRYLPVAMVKMYGGTRTDPFLGAYAEFSPGPEVVEAPFGGMPTTKPRPEHAAEFMVEQLKRYPHQVTIYCGGPLTNVALAISLHPEIVALTKEIVFMGTSPMMQPKTVNVVYDPESAQIVLHAPWPKFTIITVDVAEKLHRTRAMVEAIAKGQNQAEAAMYEKLVIEPMRQGRPPQWFRMPDELMAAYLIDPTIITAWKRFYVDVDTVRGPSYGSSLYWDEVPLGYGGIAWPDKPEPKRQKPVPAADARVAEVAWDFDIPRFTAMYLRLMTKPMP